MPTESSSLELWGRIQREFGQLGAEVRGLGQHLGQRQDDMRREVMTHIDRLDQRVSELQQPPGRKAMSWARLIPWDKIAFLAISALGAMGWIKPAWVRLLTGG